MSLFLRVFCLAAGRLAALLFCLAAGRLAALAFWPRRRRPAAGHLKGFSFLEEALDERGKKGDI